MLEIIQINPSVAQARIEKLTFTNLLLDPAHQPTSLRLPILDTRNSARSNMDAPSNMDTSNPYAYPYFYPAADGTPCGLYNLIVEFERHWKSEEDASLEQRKIVRRIESRCLSSPKELYWTDSCGDTALHRLAQMARHTSHQNVLLLCQIAKCIIGADIATVTTGNNWKETPLHSFVSHCGFPHNLSDITRLPPSGINNPMIRFVSLLCQRDAASLGNYRRCFPLHDAAEIAQVELRHDTSSASGTVVDFLEEQHAAIARLLASAAPLTLNVLDSERRTPWMRALQAPATSNKVLQVLLDRDISHAEIHRDRLAASVAKCFGPAESNAIRRGLEVTSSASHHHHRKRDLEQYVQASPLLNPLWKKTVLAASHLSSNLIHALIQTKAPVCVIALALAMSEDPREELLVQDANCQRPLEVFLQQDESESARRDADFLLELLVHANPDSCTLVMSTGQLPLHLATARQTFSWHASLASVFEAHPQAVHIRDAVTGLYPFQLAAAAHAEESTIFGLLRADPSVLRF